MSPTTAGEPPKPPKPRTPIWLACNECRVARIRCNHKQPGFLSRGSNNSGATPITNGAVRKKKKKSSCHGLLNPRKRKRDVNAHSDAADSSSGTEYDVWRKAPAPVPVQPRPARLDAIDPADEERGLRAKRWSSAVPEFGPTSHMGNGIGKVEEDEEYGDVITVKRPAWMLERMAQLAARHREGGGKQREGSGKQGEGSGKQKADRVKEKETTTKEKEAAGNEKEVTREMQPKDQTEGAVTPASPFATSMGPPPQPSSLGRSRGRPRTRPPPGEKRNRGRPKKHTLVSQETSGPDTKRITTPLDYESDPGTLPEPPLPELTVTAVNAQSNGASEAGTSAKRIETALALQEKMPAEKTRNTTTVAVVIPRSHNLSKAEAGSETDEGIGFELPPPWTEPEQELQTEPIIEPERLDDLPLLPPSQEPDMRSPQFIAEQALLHTQPSLSPAPHRTSEPITEERNIVRETLVVEERYFPIERNAAEDIAVPGDNTAAADVPVTTQDPLKEEKPITRQRPVTGEKQEFPVSDLKKWRNLSLPQGRFSGPKLYTPLTMHPPAGGLGLIVLSQRDNRRRDEMLVFDDGYNGGSDSFDDGAGEVEDTIMSSPEL